MMNFFLKAASRVLYSGTILKVVLKYYKVGRTYTWPPVAYHLREHIYTQMCSSSCTNVVHIIIILFVLFVVRDIDAY